MHAAHACVRCVGYVHVASSEGKACVVRAVPSTPRGSGDSEAWRPRVAGCVNDEWMPLGGTALDGRDAGRPVDGVRGVRWKRPSGRSPGRSPGDAWLALIDQRLGALATQTDRGADRMSRSVLVTAFLDDRSSRRGPLVRYKKMFIKKGESRSVGRARCGVCGRGGGIPV